METDILQEDEISCSTIMKSDQIIESSVKRKRGRPRKEEGRKSAPIEPRFNPDRVARHKKIELSSSLTESYSELVISTNSDDTNNGLSKYVFVCLFHQIFI